MNFNPLLFLDVVSGICEQVQAKVLFFIILPKLFLKILRYHNTLRREKHKRIIPLYHLWQLDKYSWRLRTVLKGRRRSFFAPPWARLHRFYCHLQNYIIKNLSSLSLSTLI